MTVICAQLALNKTTRATGSLLTTRKSRKLANGSGQPKSLRCQSTFARMVSSLLVSSNQASEASVA